MFKINNAHCLHNCARCITHADEETNGSARDRMHDDAPLPPTEAVLDSPCACEAVKADTRYHIHSPETFPSRTNIRVIKQYKLMYIFNGMRQP